MKTSTRWIIGIAAVLALMVGGTASIVLLAQPVRVVTTGDPSAPTPEPSPVTIPDQVGEMEDGSLAGWVTATPETPSEITIDQVEILTGNEAHDAAVDAGMISENEDLPNDMYIANPEKGTIGLAMAEDIVITVLSGERPGDFLSITTSELGELFDGSYDGAPVYGIVSGEPVLMMITVELGVVTSLEAIYLP